MGRGCCATNLSPHANDQPYADTMTNLQQVRKAATAMPEVKEAKEDSRVSFTVRRKPFAVVADGELTVWLPEGRATEVRADHPEATVAQRAGSPYGIRIPLAAINGMNSNALIRDAWTHRAPQSLSRPMTGAGPNEHDLPTDIGRPAIRALTAAGITTLDDVAAKTKGELLDLHGVGPRAVRVLEGRLADSGRTWA